MMTNTIEITIEQLHGVTGGFVPARFLINHPFAAAGFLAHHPAREAAFFQNHPIAGTRIRAIQNGWGI